MDEVIFLPCLSVGDIEQAGSVVRQVDPNCRKINNMLTAVESASSLRYLAATPRNDGLFSNVMSVIGMLHEAERQRRTPVVNSTPGSISIRLWLELVGALLRAGLELTGERNQRRERRR